MLFSIQTLEVFLCLKILAVAKDFGKSLRCPSTLVGNMGGTLPETNIAHENLIFPGKYHQNGGFSMAMLVYRSVSNINLQPGWYRC